jgi:predicted transcriptional regulator
MNTRQLPIGYWIKQVDELLTAKIDQIHSSFSLTRADWQILNTLSEQGTSHENELISLMKPFLSAKAVNEALSKLKEQQLIVEEHQNLKLSDVGKKQHKACIERQKEFRVQAMVGISEESYQITVVTLQKIGENIRDIST